MYGSASGLRSSAWKVAPLAASAAPHQRRLHRAREPQLLHDGDGGRVADAAERVRDLAHVSGDRAERTASSTRGRGERAAGAGAGLAARAHASDRRRGGWRRAAAARPRRCVGRGGSPASAGHRPDAPLAHRAQLAPARLGRAQPLRARGPTPPTGGAPRLGCRRTSSSSETCGQSPAHRPGRRTGRPPATDQLRDEGAVPRSSAGPGDHDVQHGRAGGRRRTRAPRELRAHRRGDGVGRRRRGR
jgi:hypothetical protein